MRLISRTSCIAWVALVALLPEAQAEGPDIQFSGYGTIAATYADTHSAQFRASWQQSRGSQGRIDWGVDSRIGAQLNASFNDTFSATGQLLAQRLGSKEDLAVEWLYGQAELGTHTVARVGRVVLPAFMLSDVRNVGYTQHWVRTPYEVYLSMPPIDGAQLLYRNTWEGIKFSVQPTYGRARAGLYYDIAPMGIVSAPTEFRRMKSLQITAERGNWNARFGQTIADATIGWLFMPAENVRYNFTSVGLQYDYGHLMAMAERMVGKTDSARYDVTGYYLTAGYRFGPWMPYATYASLTNTGVAISNQPDAHTAALGVRWDAFKDIAVKAQVERSRLGGQQFIGVDPALDRKNSVKVYTLSLDFVF